MLTVPEFNGLHLPFCTSFSWNSRHICIVPYSFDFYCNTVGTSVSCEVGSVSSDGQSASSHSEAWSPVLCRGPPGCGISWSTSMLRNRCGQASCWTVGNWWCLFFICPYTDNVKQFRSTVWKYSWSPLSRHALTPCLVLGVQGGLPK